MKRGRILLAAVSFCFLSTAVWAALEESGYDPFTSKMAYTPAHSVSKKIASEFLTYPFEIVRWPLNKTLIYLEENKIPAKTRYVLERMEDEGVKPLLSFAAVGGEFDLPRLLHLREELPEALTAKSWVTYAPDRIFETGATLGAEPDGVSGFQTFGNFKYDLRPEEDFFGIGPGTSEGDETSYKMETTTVESVTGYRHENSLGVDAKISYRNINIGESSSDDEVFFRDYNFADRNPAAGIHGDNLLSLGLEAFWSPEANEEKHLVPGKLRAGAEYSEGMRGSEARYLKFLVEAMKNFKLGSERRVLSVRFYGEQNTAVGNGEIPFHQMPRLGGFGPYYNLSHTLRSFEENRFTAECAALFNFEYRYRIYEYRDWTLAHVIFFDEGQTFQNFRRFRFKDFRESYGTGLRLNFLQHTVLDFEAAHGDEGTAFHIRNRRPF